MISVVMSCYNEKEKELRKAIESILNQTFNNFEFIIVLDNPKNIKIKNTLLEYKKKDKRIKLIYNETNIGLAMSLNKGIAISKYDIIARMDADDISMPDRLEKEYNYLETHKNIDCVSSKVIVIDENDNTKGFRFPFFKNNKYIRISLRLGNFISHPCAMFRKKIFNEVGGYRNFPTTQDYDLWLRFADYGSEFYIFDEYLLKYRERNEGISIKKAYLQFLCQTYIKILHTERKNKKLDSFSEENLYLFLENNNYKVTEAIEKYRYSKDELDLANNCLKKFRIFSFIKHYNNAKKTDKRVVKLFWNKLFIRILCYLY